MWSPKDEQAGEMGMLGTGKVSFLNKCFSCRLVVKSKKTLTYWRLYHKDKRNPGKE